MEQTLDIPQSDTPLNDFMSTSRPSKDLFIKTGVPAWMQPHKLDRYPLYTEYTWDLILTRLSAGDPVTIICEDPTMPEYGRLLRFIHHPDNSEYLEQYRHAQKIASESINAKLQSELMSGVDANGFPLDMDMLRERIRHGRFLMAAWNRDVYGEKKQVETTVTVDIGEAMQQAQMRLNHGGAVIEGEMVG